MNELVQQLITAAHGMWRRRWIGLTAAWIAAIIGIAVAYRIPERYEASARVYVDTETLLKPLLAGFSIQPNLDQQVALMSRTLISRPNVEKLIQMADLDLGVQTTAQRESLIDHVTKTLQLTGSTSTNLYVISYRDPSPERATKVVQSLLTIFVESSLGDKRQDSRTAVKFLDDQIKRYEENLKASEDRLKAFRLKYLGVTQEGQDYFSRLATLGAAIDAAKLDLEAAVQSRDAYKREVSGESPTFLPDSNEAKGPESVPEIDTRIAALQHDLDDLLRKYTEQHPDVIATKRLIANLEQQRRDEVAARRKTGTAAAPAGGPTEGSAVFQQLRISLADAEATVASARAKLAGYENQYRQLQARAQLVPQVEAEFAQLNRDYDVQKTTYARLLSRREAAGMGMDVQDTGGARFRVIDPPRVSREPIAPNRIALLAIACALSLVIGVVASFVASELMPVVHDARTLRGVSKRPILGMVSMLATPGLLHTQRRNAYAFAGGLGGLLVSIIAVLTLAGRIL
jgi:polysaccharide chain length determinant protein (PEP-CTERM system associated)